MVLPVLKPQLPLRRHVPPRNLHSEPQEPPGISVFRSMALSSFLCSYLPHQEPQESEASQSVKPWHPFYNLFISLSSPAAALPVFPSQHTPTPSLPLTHAPCFPLVCAPGVKCSHPLGISRLDPCLPSPQGCTLDPEELGPHWEVLYLPFRWGHRMICPTSQQGFLRTARHGYLVGHPAGDIEASQGSCPLSCQRRDTGI